MKTHARVRRATAKTPGSVVKARVFFPTPRSAHFGIYVVDKGICPHKPSPYLLWLRVDAATALGNLQPWGGAMFCGDIVESLKYVFKNNFLTPIPVGVVVRLRRRIRTGTRESN